MAQPVFNLIPPCTSSAPRKECCRRQGWKSYWTDWSNLMHTAGVISSRRQSGWPCMLWLCSIQAGFLTDPSHVIHLLGHRLQEEVVPVFWRNCPTDPSAFVFSPGSLVRNFPWPLWFFSDNSHQPCNHITEIIQASGCIPFTYSFFNLLHCYFIFSGAPSHKKGLKAGFALGIWAKKKDTEYLCIAHIVHQIFEFSLWTSLFFS